MRFLIWFVLVMGPIIAYAIIRERIICGQARKRYEELSAEADSLSRGWRSLWDEFHSWSSTKSRGYLLPHQIDKLNCINERYGRILDEKLRLRNEF